MRIGGPTDPSAWYEQLPDFKRVWQMDREVRHAVSLFPEKMRSIVIDSLIVGFVCLDFFITLFVV
jgi:hypothetical protein